MQKLSILQDKLILENQEKATQLKREIYVKKVSDLLDKFNCAHVAELDEERKIQFIGEMMKD